MHTKKYTRKSSGNVRKITKIAGGSSFSVTLPKKMIKQLGWHERQKVTVKLYRRRIIIQDWKKSK